MSELHDLTALEQAAAIARGEVSSVELTRHYLSRSEAIGERVGAFVRLTPELALEQAQAADQLVAAGSPLGPLHGVVVPVKDLNSVRGVPTTFGSALPAVPALFDDHVVQRMREAHLVFTGKTNTPEFGLPCYTENAVAPPARTPWDLSCSAGGSSGGAAAAVATGLASAGQGSDGGGSIRIPASVCGLVGIKPSRYRVSNGPLGEMLGELGVQGPLARTVADAAALLDVMSDPFPSDPIHWPVPEGGFLAATRSDPGRLRIGRFTTPVISRVRPHAECLAAFEDASRLLSDLGHEVVDTDPPFDPDVLPQFEVIWSSLAASIPVPPELETDLAPLTGWLRVRGRRLSGVDVSRALGQIRTLARDALRRSAGFDAVLSPTLAFPPAVVGGLRDDADPAHDFYAQCDFTPYTSAYNMTGQPAVTLPLHWTNAGLPIGVQLAGRPGGEATLVALGAQLERARPWAQRRPALW